MLNDRDLEVSVFLTFLKTESPSARYDYKISSASCRLAPRRRSRYTKLQAFAVVATVVIKAFTCGSRYEIRVDRYYSVYYLAVWSRRPVVWRLCIAVDCVFTRARVHDTL